MAFLHNPSENILNILYKGVGFPPLTMDFLKKADMSYFSEIKKAAQITEIMIFHQHLITFVQENPEVEKINLSADNYNSFNWDQIINFTFVDEENLTKKQKSTINKKWNTICKQHFPYQKIKDNYRYVFNFLTEIPEKINMIDEKNKTTYNYGVSQYYFELTKNNVDLYLQILLGEKHYKCYKSVNERQLLEEQFQTQKTPSPKPSKNRL